ncbi:MAG: sulfite exporter TauE/SafE family protein [Nitrospinota bacterium]
MDAIIHLIYGFGGATVWIGLVVGTLIGLTGMGGGSLLTPALIVLLGLDPLTAVGTGLAIAAVTKLVGSAAHGRLGNVDGRTTLTLLSGSLPGAIAGLGLLWAVRYTGVVTAGSLVKTAIGLTLVLAALSLWTRPLWERGGTHAVRSPALVRSSTVWVAFVVGALVSLTSVGTGTLLVPFLIFFCRLPAARVVGTDIVHGLVLTALVATLYGLGGHVEWALAAAVLVGAVPGVVLGSHLSLQVSGPTMERILGSVLLVCGLKFF